MDEHGATDDQSEELREEDVTRGDLLDDRVQEGDGLPEPRVPPGPPVPPRPAGHRPIA